MELKPISDLIDPGTWIARIMSGHHNTGYIALVLDGKIVQRRVYGMKWNHQYQTGIYIIYKNICYAIDSPLKLVSGKFDVDSLKRW